MWQEGEGVALMTFPCRQRSNTILFWISPCLSCFIFARRFEGWGPQFEGACQEGAPTCFFKQACRYDLGEGGALKWAFMMAMLGDVTGPLLASRRLKPSSTACWRASKSEAPTSKATRKLCGMMILPFFQCLRCD